MDLLFYITVFFFAWVLIRNIILWATLFDSNEYKIGKIFISFKNKSILKEYIFNIPNFAKVILFVTYFFSILFPMIVDDYPYLVFFVYFSSFITSLLSFRSDIRKLPPISRSFITLCFVILILDGFVYFFPLFDRFFWLLIIEKLSPVLLMVFVVIFSLLSDFYQDTVINNATNKILKNKSLLSVAIVGSYNKTNVKRYLQMMVSSKRTVVVTEEKHTLPRDIAHLILDHVTAKTDIFISEFSAYKTGEITEVASIVQPKIGIVTGLDFQNMPFLGNTETIKKSVQELIDVIPKKGFVFFNGNNDGAAELYSQTHKTKIFYGIGPMKGASDFSVRARQVRMNDLSTTFTLVVNDKIYGKYTVNLIGKSSIHSLLPGIGIALKIGMKKNEIRTAIERISPIPNTLQPFVSPKHVIYLNNTASQTIGSTLGAMQAIEHYKKKRIIVFSPSRQVLASNKIGYQLGTSVGIIFTHAFVTNKSYFAAVKKGIDDSGGKCKVILASEKKIMEYINKKCHPKDVILFEGRGTYNVFSQLESQPVY